MQQLLRPQLNIFTAFLLGAFANMCCTLWANHLLSTAPNNPSKDIEVCVVKENPRNHIEFCVVKRVQHVIGPYRIVEVDGSIIVTERRSDTVSVRDGSGKLIRSIGFPGDGQGHWIRKPGGIAFDSINKILYITSDHKLQKYSFDGNHIDEFGGRESDGEFNRPFGIAIKDDKVYVCDSENDRIRVFDQNLYLIKDIEIKLMRPQDITFDEVKNLIYVTSRALNCILVLTEDGKEIGRFEKLSEPTGIHIYRNFIIVSDEIVNGIKVFDMDGQFVTSFGGFTHSRGIASNSRNGHIYVCDYEKNEIVELLLCDNRFTKEHMCTCACAYSF